MRPINLLPPEAFERERSRRTVLRLLILVVAYVGLLLLLMLAWSGRAADLEREVADQEAINAELEGKVAALAPSAALLDEYERNAELLRSALADDVSWGRLLNDLGRMIPDRVWLEGLNGSAGEAAPEGGRGSLQVTGMAFAVPDVSAWVRALDSDRYPGVGATWVSTVTEAPVGEATIVRFVSQATLTDEALSGRAEQRIPVVGG